MEMEDCLPASLANVHEHAVVLEPCLARCLSDEVQHPLRLVGRKLADLAERRHVPLGQDEQVRVGPGVDVADRNEAVALGNVVTFLHELAEEAVFRQRGSLPSRRPRREPG